MDESKNKTLGGGDRNVVSDAQNSSSSEEENDDTKRRKTKSSDGTESGRYFLWFSRASTWINNQCLQSSPAIRRACDYSGMTPTHMIIVVLLLVCLLFQRTATYVPFIFLCLGYIPPTISSYRVISSVFQFHVDGWDMDHDADEQSRLAWTHRMQLALQQCILLLQYWVVWIPAYYFGIASVGPDDGVFSWIVKFGIVYVLQYNNYAPTAFIYRFILQPVLHLLAESWDSIRDRIRSQWRRFKRKFMYRVDPHSLSDSGNKKGKKKSSHRRATTTPYDENDLHSKTHRRL